MYAIYIYYIGFIYIHCLYAYIYTVYTHHLSIFFGETNHYVNWPMFKHDDLFFPEPQHLIFRPTRLLKPPSGGGRPSKNGWWGWRKEHCLWFSKISNGDFHKWGYPKWMVYNGKCHENWWFGGTPISGNLQIGPVNHGTSKGRVQQPMGGQCPSPFWWATSMPR